MKQNTKSVLLGVLGFFSIFGTVSVQASINWSFTAGSGTDPDTTNGETVSGQTFNSTNGTNSATVWGLRNDGGNGDTYGTPNSWTDNRILRAPVKIWNGLGVDDNEGYPDHATDNRGAEEMVLFIFDAPLSLGDVTIGWSSEDSDITIVAYQGTDTLFNDPSSAGDIDSYFNDKTFDMNDGVSGNTVGLVDAGWSFVEHSVVAGPVNNTRTVNDGGNATTSVSSSYWLIGALNPWLGGTSASAHNDYVKIAALGAYVPPGGGPPVSVPAPGTLLLLLFGIPLMRFVRSRERKGV